MALAAGTRFENYEVESVIGVGGMGEVYRARDMKLERPVALKVLRETFAADHDRLKRFEREAKLLASLNHPNIAQIYGLANASNGTQCLVMELVGGETLQARLRRGPLPVDEALPIARQIAAAIEAAHERGIVHRDLKPGNVMIDGDGRVKVLDFGLGKALEPAGAADELTHSPTMLSDRFTQANVLIGTAAYMSPEQARGKVADERSDIWAFGCVLYEMLTGRPPFGGGETVTDLLSDILRVEPDWKALYGQTPPGLHLILKRCLQKDRRQRYHAIGDLRHDLETAAAVPPPITVPPRRATIVERIAWIAALCAVATAGVLLGATYFAPTAVAPIASRFVIDLPSDAALVGQGPVEPLPAVSPDGRLVVFRMITAGHPAARLYVRPIGSLNAEPLAGTEAVVAYPFWSADSRFVGFFADGKLKKVSVAGGPPQVVTDGIGPGGTWNQDDVILFTEQGSIRRASAVGGASTSIRTPDKSRNEVAYSWPSFLPDGRHFLYVAVSTDPGKSEIRVGSLDEESDTSLFAGSSRVMYTSPNHLLFVRDGTLMAQPFDTRSLSLTGAAFPIAESVGFIGRGGTGGTVGGAAAFGVAATGTLVYRVGPGAAASELTWFDRSGKRLGILPSNGGIARPVFSPDQTRVAGERPEGNVDVWMLDVTRGTNSRFTFDPATDFAPIFSPDGAQVAFSSDRGGTWGLYVKPAAGVGAEQLLLKVPGASQVIVGDWSPDGRLLLYTPAPIDSAEDVWVLPLTGDRKPYALLNQKYNERRPRFSPDGRWILYSSNETGREEIYVQAFPPSGGKWQVSVNGAAVGYWKRDGREIIFDSLDRKIMAVDVKLGTTFEAGIPRPLFELPATIVGGRFAMTADGQRFLIPLPSRTDETAAIRVVLNWPADIGSR
jgi:eukaryotic-like serine/threonine-protein kinase